MQRFEGNQGELAKEHGIDGFVYHHYWFYDDCHHYPGRPHLHAPLMKMLEDGYPDIPFCLHWVAENWTATCWHRKQGNESDADRCNTLLQRQYFPKDPKNNARITAHYRFLQLFFHHHNYITDSSGKPILMVYRHEVGLHGVIVRLQELAVQDGFPGLTVTLGMYASNDELFPKGAGLGHNETLQGENRIFDRLTNYPYPFNWLKRERYQVPSWCLRRDPQGQPRNPNLIGVVSSFDNTPRREFKSSRLWITREGTRGVLRHFGKNLWAAIYYHACCYAEGGGDQYILINAWNEWAEGMALEPSNVYKDHFLRIIQGTKYRKFSSCARSFGP